MKKPNYKIGPSDLSLSNSDIDQRTLVGEGVENNGILVPVRTSFGLRRRGVKTHNVST